MHRFITIFFLLLSISLLTTAQVAVDFTETDIYGQEHNLYEYLDDGKIVVLEVFSTTCGPCLKFHKGKTLDHLQSILGPEAKDKIVVLSFEKNPNSDDEALYGIGDKTYGDFVSGTSYPIFNPSEISEEFEKTYVAGGTPTINFICPETKQVSQFASTRPYVYLLNEVMKCGSVADFTELMTVGKWGTNKVCESYKPAFTVLNGGSEDVDLKANLLHNGEVVHSNANFGRIYGGQKKAIAFHAQELSGSVDDFTIELLIDDENKENNDFGYSVTKTETLSKEASLHLKTGDSFEFHASPNTNANSTWSIEDSERNIIYEAKIEIGVTEEIKLDLIEGECYSLRVVGNHHTDLIEQLELIDINGKVITANYNWKDYDGPEYFQTGYGSSFVEETIKINAKLYPSPVKDVLTINIADHSKELHLSIFDIKGLEVYSEKSISTDIKEKRIDCSDYSSGIYFVQLSYNSEVQTLKFVKE